MKCPICGEEIESLTKHSDELFDKMIEAFDPKKITEEYKRLSEHHTRVWGWSVLREWEWNPRV